MTKIIKKYKKETKGFFGIDMTAPFGEGGCEDIQNFRMTSSGALVKRTGRKNMRSFQTYVCSVIPYRIEKDFQITDMLVAAPPYVYELDKNGDICRTLCSDAGLAWERVCLGFIGGVPHLFDGTNIRAYDKDTDSFFKVTPYVPLYGKDWDPSTLGEIHEPPNILTNSIRVSYTATESANKLRLPHGYAFSEGTKNGKPLSSYSFNEETGTLTVSMEKGDKFELTAYGQNHPLLNALRACRSFCTVGGEDEHVICFDSELDGSALFCSSPTSDGALYFREDMRVRAGSDENPVTAVCPCGDGFAAATESNTFLGSFDGTRVDLFLLCGGIGSRSRAALCSDMRNIYTISEGGFYRIEVNFSAPGESKSEKISAPLERDGHLRTDRDSLIFDNEPDGELWFCLPQSIFIYQKKLKGFCRFIGMSPVAVLTQGDGILLFEHRGYWRFFDNLYFDIDSEGSEQPIYARLTTRWTALGDITAQKRGLTVTPVFSLEGGDGFTLSVKTDTGLNEDFKIVSKNAYSELIIKKLRAARCRFNFARFEITSNDKTRLTVHGAVITAT